MDKLTAIKIKYDDGTYSDKIPVSVLSENVQWDNTHTLVDVLGSINVDVTGTIQDQISQLFNEKISATQLQNYVASQLNEDVSTWLNNNVDPVGSAVIVDSSLTISGAAADAKKTGDEISDLKNDLTLLEDGLYDDILSYSKFVQGVRYTTNAGVIINTNNRCTMPYGIDAKIGDVITIANIPSGFRAAIVSLSRDESGWKTDSFTYIVPATSTFFVNVSTSDGTSQLTPSDFELTVTKKDNTSRITALKSDIDSVASDLSTANDEIEGILSKIDAARTPYYVYKHMDFTELGKKYIADDGSLKNASAKYCYKLICEEGNRITLTSSFVINSSYAIAFYKSDNTFISGVKPTSTSVMLDVVCPKYTGYAIICTDSGTLNPNVKYNTRLYSVTYLPYDYEDIVKLKKQNNDTVIPVYSNAEKTITYYGQYLVDDIGDLAVSGSMYLYKMICEYGQRVVYEGQSSTYYWAISFFDSDDCFISGIKPTTVSYAIDTVCPYGTAYCYLLSYSSVITPNITSRTHLYDVDYAIDGDTDKVPSYWYEELDTSIAVIHQNELTIGANGVEFFFVTDTHWAENAGNSGKILGKLSKELNIPLVIFGGDAILSHADTKAGAVSELETFYGAYNKDFDLLSTVGNHDLNTNNNQDTTTYLGSGDLYSLMMRRSESFSHTAPLLNCGYYDNESQKVRYIQFYCPEGGAISSDVLTWVDAKITELSSEWTIILFCHAYFNGASAGEPVTIPATSEANAQHFANLNCNATIACWIVGHVHRDVSDTSNGILVIATSCDIYQQSTPFGGPTMTIGTDTEQCIDCFQIDTANKKIYATRIGAGNDRSFDYDTESQTFGELI